MGFEMGPEDSYGRRETDIHFCYTFISKTCVLTVRTVHSNNSMLSKHITHHLMDSSIDPTCPDCGQATHTMEHWLLECSAITYTRVDIFGRPDLTLDVLCTSPLEAITLAGRNLF